MSNYKLKNKYLLLSLSDLNAVLGLALCRWQTDISQCVWVCERAEQECEKTYALLTYNMVIRTDLNAVHVIPLLSVYNNMDCVDSQENVNWFKLI